MFVVQADLFNEDVFLGDSIAGLLVHRPLDLSDFLVSFQFPLLDLSEVVLLGSAVQNVEIFDLLDELGGSLSLFCEFVLEEMVSLFEGFLGEFEGEDLGEELLDAVGGGWGGLVGGRGG